MSDTCHVMKGEAQCTNAATHHPVAVFTNERGAAVRCIIGLKICDSCRRGFRLVSDFMPDGGDKLAEALGRVKDKSGKASAIVRRALTWSRLDSEESLSFARINAAADKEKATPAD